MSFILKSILSLLILLMTGVTFSQELLINVSLKQPKILEINAGMDISVENPANIIIGEDVTVSGGTSEYQYSWSDDYGDVFNSKIVSVSSFGSYYLTVTDANNCSAKDTLQVINSVYIDPETAGRSLILFPNPSTGSVYVPLQGFTDDLQIKMVSTSGKEIFNKHIIIIPGELYHEINMKDMTGGTYHIILENSMSRKVCKMILE